MKKTIVFTLFKILTCLLTICNGHKDEGDSPGFMLPGNLVPRHYDVNWIFLDNCPENNNFTFERRFYGSTKINAIAIKSNVTVVELNSYKLNITKATVQVGEGRSPSDLGIPKYYNRERKVVFKLPFVLPKSQPLTFDLTFEGVINDPDLGEGILVTKDVVQGVIRETIGSQFEAPYARTAFPCFDEPKYKATFRVSVNVSTCVVTKGYLAHSNTIQENRIEKNGRYITYFEKTKFVMSTYLLAIVVSPYVSTTVNKFNSSYPDVSKTEWKEIRTWGTKEEVESWMGFVVQTAGARLMEVFSASLNLGYPLEKMDLIAIYNTIPMGMENWGMIDFGFVRNSNKSTIELISHEISHQWFGDIVTCNWWSELWLNEGFATYFSYFGAENIRLKDPNTSEWNEKISLLLNEVLVALNADDGQHSRPLSYPIEDPAQFPERFDWITYKKGGSILRMWSYILGENIFLKGLQNYLQAGKFGSSTSELLFQAFDSIANLSSSNFKGGAPSKYFKNWITQSGYPLVTVKKSETNTSEYIVKQHVFGAARHSKKKWTIPISYSTDSNPDFNKTHAMLWLKEEENETVIRLPSPVYWIVVNNQFAGYYRVNYDRENWHRIAKELMNPEGRIPEANRIQIIDDLIHIFVNGEDAEIDFDFILDLSLYLKHETSYYPWKAALDHLIDWLDTMLFKMEAFYPVFKKYVRDLLESHYARLSFTEQPTDSFSDKELRKEIVRWACKMDDSQCIKDSQKIVNMYTPRIVPYHSMFETAYCNSIRLRKEHNWFALWENYTSLKDFDEKRVMLNGISCSNDEVILKRMLMKAIDETANIQKEERKAILSAVLNGNPRNAGILLDFLNENYMSINMIYDEYRPLSESLLLLSRKLGTDEEVAKLKRLATILGEDDRISLTDGTIPQVLKISSQNNKFLKNKSLAVTTWLTSRYG